MSNQIQNLNGVESVNTAATAATRAQFFDNADEKAVFDEHQERLLCLAISNANIAAQVVERGADFHSPYQLLISAMRDGYATTRQNYSAWLEHRLDGTRFTPADVAANMNVYNRISIKGAMAKVADAAGLFLRLDESANAHKRQVAVRRLKGGDESAIAGLESMGVDTVRLRAAMIVKRLGTKVYDADDIGNGQLFADSYADDLRYISEWKRWIRWDGKRWAAVNAEAVNVMAQEIIRHVMPMLAATIKEDDRRTRYLKHTAASTTAFKVAAMVDMAKGRMSVNASALDASVMLFNVQNGTLNCETGDLKPHDRRDMLTKISPCSYNPSATCPTWDAFLKRIIVDAKGETDAETLRYLQTAVGYSMTGSVREECMIVLFGKGGTGKSTLTETVLHCMGDYGLTLATSVLLDQNAGGNNDNIADLCGVRCAIANETKAGGRFNEERVKAITGGDRMTAMRKYERPFQFLPQHKIWLACNDRPKVSPTDEGMWRRLRLVPFLAELKASEKDVTLKTKLKAEADGIMAWMIAGLRMWLANGLPIPKVVETATAEYRADADVFGQFIADCCIIATDAKVRASELFKAYQQWAEDNGMSYPLSAPGVVMALKGRGYAQHRRADGQYWFGIGLHNADDNPSATDDRAF